MPPRVVLIGAPASGKSKIARLVAASLGCLRIDTDKVIVEEHGEVAEIFERYGEQVFREWERQAVVTALTLDAVVSLGGGAVVNADTQRDLASAHCVLLTVSAEAVAPRLATSNKRPLLTNGVQAWVELVAQREPIYLALADRTFDTSHRPLEDIAAEICEWIEADYPESSGPEGEIHP